MARGHALMGGAVWLAGCAVVAQFTANHLPPFELVVIGTPVCAGWAIVPDIDHPNSTIARSASVATKGLAAATAAGCRVVHAATKTRWDREDKDGHRTVTHTFLFALLFGVLVGLAGWYGGRWVAGLLVFWPAHIGIGAAVKSRRRREYWFRRTLRIRVRRSISDALLLAAVAAALDPGSAWWLGLAAGGGVVIHLLGDMMTDSAVPAAWPIILHDDRGRPLRWRPIGLPRRWRFAAGSDFEVISVHRLLMAASAAALLVIGWPVIAAVAARVGQN